MVKTYLILTAGSALLLGACSNGGASTYAISSEQAVAKLLKADSKIVGFGGDVSVSSPEANVVLWTITGPHAILQCTATATAVAAGESTVATSCGGSSPTDGAAEGSLIDMVNTLVDEHVAATLLDRPFDAKKAEMKMVASFAKNLPTMQKSALQMDADMKAAHNELAEAAEADQDMVVGETEDTASVE